MAQDASPAASVLSQPLMDGVSKPDTVIIDNEFAADSTAAESDTGKTPEKAKKKRLIIIAVIAACVVVALGLGLGLGLHYGLQVRQSCGASCQSPQTTSTAVPDDGSSDAPSDDKNTPPDDDDDDDKSTPPDDKDKAHDDKDKSGDSDDGPGPVVDLGYTRLRGNYLDNGIAEYLGVRFAQPPTGDLRWRAPADPKKSSKVQDATKFGAHCLSTTDTPNEFANEDCLFANIWAPTNATADDKLPVQVFIQGGGYYMNSNANWNGSLLVEASDKGHVFIAFNYRVGLWGFLAGDEVKSDGDLNAGLLDQRALFHWVQNHISAFGGDPDHVVIHGSSAGAGSVTNHMVAYGGKDEGLFHAAITESNFWPQQPHADDLEYQFTRTVENMDCADADNKMDCLRGKSSEELQQKANVVPPFPGRGGSPKFYWTPCIDGDFLEDIPYNLYESGKAIHVPVLAGICSNEGSQFAASTNSRDEMLSFMQDNYPGLTPSQVDDIADLYPKESELPRHGDWFPSTSRAYGEATFICPTDNYLNALYSSAEDSSDANSTALWSYRFNVVTEANTLRGVGVPHSSALPAVFGTSGNQWTIPEIQGYWLSFIRTLDPNTLRHEGSPVWGSWGGSDSMSRMVLDPGHSKMEDVGKGERERCDFWQNSAKDTLQK